MPRDTGLVDQNGNRIIIQDLKRAQAAPSLTGVRQNWDESIAAGLTPQRLAAILRAAASNEPHDFLTLAEQMEELNMHYQAELSKRKLAVTRLPISIEAGGETPQDKKIATAVRQNLIERIGVRGLFKDILDAIGKGYSVNEINWQTNAEMVVEGATMVGWRPRSYEWRDPRWFQFDRVDRKTLRLRDEANLIDGVPLTPYKYIVHIHKIKSGNPIRGGIAYMAAWSWMFKNYSLKDWLAFAEVFGMPLRLGKYHQGASEDDIRVLKQALAGLGIDAAAAFPKSMEIELVETSKAAGSDQFFKVMADYFDKQISIGILGQTATTEGTSGALGNETARSDVRDDIRDDDAEQLEDSINRDLVIPWVDLNFGTQRTYPRVQIRAIDAEDLEKWTKGLVELVDRGFQIDQSVVHDRYGTPAPKQGTAPANLLHPKNQGTTVPPAPETAATAQNAAHRCNCSVALNQTAQSIVDNFDELMSFGLDQWQEQVDPLLAPLRRAAAEATDYADFIARLKSQELWQAMDHNPVVDRLAQVLAAARLLGEEGE